MTSPGSTVVSASSRVPSETCQMIERMRSSDEEEMAASAPASSPSSSSPKAGSSSGGRPPRVPPKSTLRSKEENVEVKEEEGGGFMSSILSKIDASIACATISIIPGAQCSDIEQGDFDLGRIDDVAQKLYTRVAGGSGKKTRPGATFDDDTIATMDTGADTGYYSGYTGVTGLTRGTAASASARSQCESTVGRGAHKAGTNKPNDAEEDLVGDDDDTIEDGNSTGMTRSSTFQTTLTMNTLNSRSTNMSGAVGAQSVGTVGGSKMPLGQKSVIAADSAVSTIAAIGAGDIGVHFESAGNITDVGDVPLRQRTQSADRSDAAEPTGLDRSTSNATGMCSTVSSERRSLVCFGASIEVELGKEPNKLPPTAVDVDECSIDDDDDDDDDDDMEENGELVDEAPYNIMYVHQDEPSLPEQTLGEPSLLTQPSYCGNIEEIGQEIDFASFKAGLESSGDGKDAQNVAISNELDNKDSKGLVVAKTNFGGGRITSEKKKKLKKTPFFASPPISTKKVPPPPFFASSSTNSKKSKADQKRKEMSKSIHVSTAGKKKETKGREETASQKLSAIKRSEAVDLLDTTAEESVDSYAEM